MRLARPMLRTIALLCSVAVAVGGCAGSSGDTLPAGPSPAARPESFPVASGLTLEQLVQGIPQGPVLSAAVSVLEPARTNRFTFSLLDRARQQIRGAQVALYAAGSGGAGVIGPFVARSVAIGAAKAFTSRSAATSLDAIRSVYLAAVRFPGIGRRRVVALTRLDGRLVASRAIQVVVGGAGPPDVGDRAPRIHTPTAASVGGDLARIDTRIPHSTMHGVDYAGVIGRRPMVIAFASPGRCPSGFCGRVLDALEAVKAQVGRRISFIHMEAYGPDRGAGVWRPQARAFRLRTQPWVFAIDRSGRVAARFEGPASPAELRSIVERVLQP